MVHKSFAQLMIACALLYACPANAQVDPHGLYERKCLGCHSEHAADLARQKFKLDSDVLSVARTGARVDVLLRKHHGVSLSGAEATALVGLFKSGITWAGVYQRLCARCHDKAVSFARDRLAIREGQLVSRKAGTEIGAVLKQHGGASDAEIATLLEMLRYQLATETTKPAP